MVGLVGPPILGHLDIFCRPVYGVLFHFHPGKFAGWDELIFLILFGANPREIHWRIIILKRKYLSTMNHDHCHTWNRMEPHIPFSPSILLSPGYPAW